MKEKLHINNNHSNTNFRRSLINIFQSLPVSTVMISIILIAFNYHLIFSKKEMPYWHFFICDRGCVINGEMWRLLLSFFPHADLQHLLEDTIYFTVVSSLTVFFIGRRIMLWGVVLCQIGSSVLFVLFDTRFSCNIGSSAASHGLVALLASNLVFRRERYIDKAIGFAVICYLIYLSLYAVKYGVMGWPLTMLPNGGYDHLGGVIIGVMLGLFAVRWSKA